MTIALAAAFACLCQEEAEYFPAKKGTAWTYVWEDGKVDKVVSRGTVKKGGWEYAVFDFDVQNGASKRNEWYYIGEWEGFKGVMYCGQSLDADEPEHDCDTNPILLIKFGAKKGDSWKREEEGRVTTFEHLGEEEVAVPAGKYKAIGIRRSYVLAGEKCATTDWYAKGVGLVKKEDTTGTLKSTMQLKEVK